MIKEGISLKVIVFAESVCKNNAFLLVIISIWIPFHALKRSNLTFKVEANQETCFIASLINLISEAFCCQKCCQLLSDILKIKLNVYY